MTVWPEQSQHACNEAADHQVVKKGRGSSYESPPPPPAIPPRQPRNQNPVNSNVANTATTSTAITNSNTAIKEDKSSNQVNGTGRSKGAPTLHRQGAINFESSHPPGFEPRTTGLGLDHQQSIESTTSNQSHINQLRRPRSLTHQSVGSQHGFSLFGSVDSEQSVPRTAPLATPEQVSKSL